MCNSRFAICNVPLHLVDVDFTYVLAILIGGLVWSVHVNVHNVLSNCLHNDVSIRRFEKESITC